MQLPTTVESIVAFLGVLRAGMIATNALTSMLRDS
jgi:acyl-CoA synthetase (AMP-forming)/AMP-acid ligase II